MLPTILFTLFGFCSDVGSSTSETSVGYYQSTLLHVQEYFNLHEEGCENLQSRDVDTI